MFPNRSGREFDGVQYDPGARFRVIAEGARLVGWVAIRGGAQGWVQDLNPGDVVTCDGFGPGMGSDPGFGVEFISDASEEAGAFHCEIQPGVMSIWSYRPQPGVIEPIEAAAERTGQ